jgi:hypothetical protein
MDTPNSLGRRTYGRSVRAPGIVGFLYPLLTSSAVHDEKDESGWTSNGQSADLVPKPH